MSGHESESRKSRESKPHTTVQNAANLSALQQAGAELGVEVTVLAAGGEEYEYCGVSGTVREDGLYVQIKESPHYHSDHAKEGLAPFWRRAKEIQGGN